LKTFQWTPSPSWVSKFCRKRKIRSHLTQKRPAKRNRDSIAIELKEFRKKINDQTNEEKRRKKGYSQVWHADESGVWDDGIPSSSYSLIGTTPQINTPDSHRRDTIIACISNTGLKLDKIKIIEHKTKKYSRRKNKITGEWMNELVDKGISGLNLPLWRDWIKNDFLIDPKVSLGDTLVVDQLAAHKDIEICQLLRDKGLNFLFFFENEIKITNS